MRRKYAKYLPILYKDVSFDRFEEDFHIILESQEQDLKSVQIEISYVIEGKQGEL